MIRDIHFFHQSKAHFLNIEMSSLNISGNNSVGYYSDIFVVPRNIYNISPSHERFPSAVAVATTGPITVPVPILNGRNRVWINLLGRYKGMLESWGSVFMHGVSKIRSTITKV